MRLPQAVEKWSSLLSLFPADLALSLGQMVRELEQLIKPLKNALESGLIEPDGYADLTRKGSYEHLLISEWALADEFPLEFDRRAAMNEHLFYKYKTIEPKGSRYSVLLLDRGLLQLGKPRLAHLALIILFERRARDANAAFYWGSLQEPGILETEVNQNTLSGYLQTKKLAPVTEKQIFQWRDWFECNNLIPADTDDLWQICPATTLPEFAGAKYIRINEVIQLAGNQLGIEVINNKKARFKLVDLPDNNHCTRLIREPFKQQSLRITPQVNSQALQGKLVFSKTGVKLLGQTASNKCVVYSVPNTSRDRPGRVRIMSVPHLTQLVAVQTFKRRKMGISFADNKLYFNNIPWFSCPLLDLNDYTKHKINFSSDSMLRPFHYSLLYHEKNNPSVYLLDDDQQLFRFYQYSSASQPTVRKIANNVLTVSQTDQYISYVNRVGSAHSEPKLRIHLYSNSNSHVESRKSQSRYIEGPFGINSKAFIHHGFNLNQAFVAVASEHQWEIHNHQASAKLRMHEQEKVLGIFPYENNEQATYISSPDSVYLVYISTDRHSIFIANTASIIQVCTEAAEIVSASYDPVYCRVAYYTRSNITAVFSLLHWEFLLRLGEQQ